MIEETKPRICASTKKKHNPIRYKVLCKASREEDNHMVQKIKKVAKIHS